MAKSKFLQLPIVFPATVSQNKHTVLTLWCYNAQYVIKYLLCFNIQLLSQKQGSHFTEHQNLQSI